MPGLEPLVAGAPVLIAGARVTGRAILGALTRFGAVATLCDDDPAMLSPYAENGVPTVDPATAIEQIAEYALVVTSPGFQPSAPVLAAAAWACRSGVTSSWPGASTPRGVMGRRAAGWL